MRYVTETNPGPNLIALLEAAQAGPVFIQRDETDVAVLVSVREYDRLRDTAVREFQSFCDSVGEKAAAAGLTEEKLGLLLSDV